MEPLSAAASVMSMVSLALEIAESVSKLLVNYCFPRCHLLTAFGGRQDFFSALENAPHDVERISRTIDLLSIILNQLRKDFCDDENDVAIGLALEECKKCIQEVNDMVSDLAPAFTSGDKAYRSWTALKTVNRAKVISKLENRHEQAKTTLTLALHNSTR